MKKKILMIVIIFMIILSTYLTYANFKASATGNINVTTAKFSYELKSSEIALKDTIINDKELVPSAKGKFDVEIDFSDMEVSTNYEIAIDKSNIPNNIHFYSDSALTDEITTLSNTYYLNSDVNKKDTIYWEWEFKDDETSNSNDTNFMNKDIKVVLNINLTQKVGDN